MDLQIFNYESREIRTAIGKNSEMLFAAKDVCDILELNNVSQALSRIDEDEKDDIISSDAIGRNQSIAAITESGVYALIFSSKKTEARKFRKWITSEVLPSLRKTGSYTVQSITPVNISQASSVYRALRSVAKSMGLTGNQLTLSVNRATKNVTEVDFQNLLGMDALVNEAQEFLFTSTDLGARIGLSAMKFNKKLEQEGFQLRQGMVWTPTDKGRPYAVLLDTAKKHSDGTPVIQVKWKESIMSVVA